MGLSPQAASQTNSDLGSEGVSPRKRTLRIVMNLLHLCINVVFTMCRLFCYVLVCHCCVLSFRRLVVDAFARRAPLGGKTSSRCSFMVISIDLKIIVEEITFIRIVEGTIALLTEKRQRDIHSARRERESHECEFHTSPRHATPPGVQVVFVPYQ